MSLSITTINILLLALSILAGCLLAFTEPIAKEFPGLLWIKSLIFRISMAVIVIGGTWFLNFRKDAITKQIADVTKHISDSIAERKTFISDSLHREYEFNISLVQQKQLTETMAKYGLKYDSAAKSIKKLVSDSMRSAPDPEIDFCDDGIVLDSTTEKWLFFNVTLCNRIAQSKIIKCFLYKVYYKDGTFHLFEDVNRYYDALPPGTSLRSPDSYSSKHVLPKTDAERLFFVLKGTYSNLDGTKVYNQYSPLMYVVKSGMIGVPASTLYTRLEDYVKTIK